MPALWIGKCRRIIIFSLLWPVAALSDDDLLIQQLRSEFQRGNYQAVERTAKEAIEKASYRLQDYRLVSLYVYVASDLRRADTLLERVYINSKEHSPAFYNAIVSFMERALVAGDLKLVEKWGYRFRYKGKLASRYAEGLYLYACLLHEMGRYQDANFVLSLALKESPDRILQKKIDRLKGFLQDSG